MRFKKIITFLMLIVFFTLAYTSVRSTNCDQFGHIHLVNLEKTYSANSVEKVITQASDVDDSCHGGKAISALVICATMIVDVVLEIKIDKIRLRFDRQALFRAPFIEPHKKPPKIS